MKLRCKPYLSGLKLCSENYVGQSVRNVVLRWAERKILEALLIESISPSFNEQLDTELLLLLKNGNIIIDFFLVFSILLFLSIGAVI